MSAYDLILQGGTLYDPCAGTMELCDLAMAKLLPAAKT